MNIGERIRTFREKSEMTQTELAQKIGSTKQTVYKYENGVVTNIPYDKLILLAKALETTPAVLMGWETPPEGPQTLAAHFEGDDFTEEELQDIMAYAEFVKSRRKSGK
ncbi:hypothetical protein HMPREF1093_03529 [Hungatella hathewayi 12489931]|jgi:transcriptional regulator with XRE-family HTH domain|uniref:helix-turn-helix domain-containing protein n=1 Tax=Hungatella hathewayi TaxID=154046 RepID=UPI0002D19380|nr:helix-turn-helix transcriptional regulator [Hungatella hathewayi]ENY93453.1 hypothetical protein HMPREF1093_03529 [Hungatella hathewayi 12489931]